MNKIFKIQKNKKSFSIGEVMLSVFILGVTLVTVSQLFVSGLKNFADTRDSIIASMLAQEGIELVRNARDNNWAKGNNSFSGFSNGTCVIDINNPTCVPVTNVNQKKLRYNNGFYVHGSGGVGTRFRRSIKIGVFGSIMVASVQVLWDPSVSFTNNPNCTIAHKCAFSSVVLTKWGE